MPRLRACDCGVCALCRHREASRRYRRTARGRATAAARLARHLAVPANAERHSAVKRKWDRENPVKRRAYRIVRLALASGDLVRPARCERCSGDGRLEAHHADYSEPLRVEWLCSSCHRFEHEEGEEVAA